MTSINFTKNLLKDMNIMAVKTDKKTLVRMTDNCGSAMLGTMVLLGQTLPTYLHMVGTNYFFNLSMWAVN
jgi:hypothetical protein